MLMVFAVMIALIILAQVFLFKKNPATQPSQKPAETTQSTPAATQAATPAAPAQASSQPSDSTAKVAPKAASKEVETTVENDFYRIVFTNKGAQVISWVLKKFKDDDGYAL